MENELATKCHDIKYVRGKDEDGTDNYNKCCPVTVGPPAHETIYKHCGIVTREKMELEQKRIDGMQNQDGECYICSSISGNIENGVLLVVLLVLLFVVFRKDIKIKFLLKYFK